MQNKPILPKMAKTFYKIPTFLHFTLEKFELYQHFTQKILTNTSNKLCIFEIKASKTIKEIDRLTSLKSLLGVEYPTVLVKYLAN